MALFSAGKGWFYARGDSIPDSLQGVSGGDLGGQGSWMMGWIIQTATPTYGEIREWGSGLSFNVDAFFIIGGGLILNPSQPTRPGVYVGVGIGGGPGGSFNYPVR